MLVMNSMPVYPDLKKKVVLVTGGAQGIGRATVRAFSAQGAQVHFCDTHTQAGRALAKEIRGPSQFTRVDLVKEKDIQEWIYKVAREEDHIDVLVNNAAIDPRIPFETMNTEQWDLLFANNLRAFFLTAREALPYFPKRGAAIVNLASITIHTAPVNLTAYVSTKGGILAFTRSLARELGPRGIRVNAVSPGWIMTERQLKQYATPAVKRLIKRAQCIPTLLQPEEISQVILFLASEASRAITGQEILADRGWAHS